MLDVSERDGHWRVFRIIAVPGAAGNQYIEEWRRKYGSFRAMPRKTQEAVAVLSMYDDGDHAQGIGTKVSCSTFWVTENEDILKEYEE